MVDVGAKPSTRRTVKDSDRSTLELSFQSLSIMLIVDPVSLLQLRQGIPCTWASKSSKMLGKLRLGQAVPSSLARRQAMQQRRVNKTK